MAFRLIPRDEGFFPLFEKATEISHECAQRLVGILHSVPPTETEVDAIMAAERQADEVVREISRRLDRSLVTPFDREDIQLLATSLDDVTDEIEVLAFVSLQEVEQQLGLAAARAEMDVGQEDRPMAGRLVTLDDAHENTLMWIRPGSPQNLSCAIAPTSADCVWEPLRGGESVVTVR
mgnify:CR=1 FL=1